MPKQPDSVTGARATMTTATRSSLRIVPRIVFFPSLGRGKGPLHQGVAGPDPGAPCGRPPGGVPFPILSAVSDSVGSDFSGTTHIAGRGALLDFGMHAGR